jgi:hypothetical protein
VVPQVPKASIAAFSASRLLLKGLIWTVGEHDLDMQSALSFQVGSPAPAPGAASLYCSVPLRSTTHLASAAI